tara:strand:- start:419 stop:979 length:561 start_codon:yes stop_codon:yes gene_type:complete
MEFQSLEIWSVIGTWVSSIGTVGAVITSLWFSYNNQRVKLSVTAGHRKMVERGVDSHPDYCYIKVVNLGDRMVRITNLGWRAGRFFRKREFLQLFSVPESDQVPKNLEHGEEATFLIPFRLRGDDDKDWIVSFPKGINTEKVDRLSSLRVIVTTSVGQTTMVKAEKGLIDKLQESYKSNKNTEVGI